MLLLFPVMLVQGATPVTITGTVQDSSGEPLTGVSVMLKGSSTGGSTNVDGQFTVKAPVGGVLKFSYIGYAPQEVKITGEQPITVVMEEDTKALDEVVVTALGIKRSEKALSYNVQKVSTDQITAVKDANFMNSLAGKVAGVTINANATGAGGASRVVMRGVKSINGDNQALYVIDGVPMFNLSSGDGVSSIYSGQPGSDGVADINPEDIESVSMLTGPAAAALYGNAAANGVVLITTKKGEEGKTSVTYSNSTMFTTAYMTPKLQSKYGNKANDASSWGDVVNSSFDANDFFRTGVNEINSLTLSTGTSKNQTFFSAASTNTTNILPNSGYNRYNFNVRNTTTFLNDKLVLDANMSYIVQNDKNMMAQGIYNNPLIGLYLFPRGENFDDVRMFERYSPDNEVMEQYWPYGMHNEGLYNPYWMQNRIVRENKKKRYMLGASLKWNITDWLNIIGRVKIDNYYSMYTYKAYASSNQAIGPVNGRGSYTENSTESENTYADIIANINKAFGNDWSLNANIGGSINDSRYRLVGYSGSLNLLNFFTIHNINYNLPFQRPNTAWHDQVQALFANVEVGWKSMLYLTATGRNDWDSHLAFSKHTSFFYPSVGLSAILTNMIDVPQWITFLKVRASYTEVGKAYDRFLTTISYPYDGSSWSVQSAYPNTDLKPERTKSWEVGFDARLLNNIKLGLTYYRSNTNNQTFSINLSESAGYKSLTIQTGRVMNEGIELLAGFEKNWGDWHFNTTYTLTWNRNEIKKLSEGLKNVITGEPIELEDREMVQYGNMQASVRLRTGGSMGDVYATSDFERDAEGRVIVTNNSPSVVTTDPYYLGSILPKINMGLSLNGGYKGINLGMTFTGRIGGICISQTQSMLNSFGVSQESADIRDAGGTVPVNWAEIPIQSFYAATSSFAPLYTYSATNFRLGELSLNYTLPRKWFKDKMGMTVGFVGKNLWMIYCKAPFDPELTSSSSSNYYQGFDYYMLPSMRSYGFNVKLNF